MLTQSNELSALVYVQYFRLTVAAHVFSVFFVELALSFLSETEYGR